jgi:hypothetical protein
MTHLLQAAYSLPILPMYAPLSDTPQKHLLSPFFLVEFLDTHSAEKETSLEFRSALQPERQPRSDDIIQFLAMVLRCYFTMLLSFRQCSVGKKFV